MHKKLFTLGKASSLLLFFPLYLLISGCAPKDASVVIMTNSQEEKLGAEFHAQLLANSAEYPIFQADTPEKQAFKTYITQVFLDVYNSIPKEDEVNYNKDPFTFTIIDANVENAFAVAGGYVYIYTGIIKSMQDESELAGVLGHEIAHITMHHYRRSIAGQAVASTLIDALVGEESKLTDFVKGSFSVLAGSYLSRDHEAESDERGTVYLANSGRNPLGIASYFSRMEDSGLKWLSSHPEASERVSEVQAQVDKESSWSSLLTEEKKFKDTFLENTAAIR